MRVFGLLEPASFLCGISSDIGFDLVSLFCLISWDFDDVVLEFQLSYVPPSDWPWP